MIGVRDGNCSVTGGRGVVRSTSGLYSLMTILVLFLLLSLTLSFTSANSHSSFVMVYEDDTIVYGVAENRVTGAVVVEVGSIASGFNCSSIVSAIVVEEIVVVLSRVEVVVVEVVVDVVVVAVVVLLVVVDVVVVVVVVVVGTNATGMLTGLICETDIGDNGDGGSWMFSRPVLSP